MLLHGLQAESLGGSLDSALTDAFECGTPTHCLKAPHPASPAALLQELAETRRSVCEAMQRIQELEADGNVRAVRVDALCGQLDSLAQATYRPIRT